MLFALLAVYVAFNPSHIEEGGVCTTSEQNFQEPKNNSEQKHAFVNKSILQFEIGGLKVSVHA